MHALAYQLFCSDLEPLQGSSIDVIESWYMGNWLHTHLTKESSRITHKFMIVVCVHACSHKVETKDFKKCHVVLRAAVERFPSCCLADISSCAKTESLAYKLHSPTCLCMPNNADSAQRCPV